MRSLFASVLLSVVCAGFAFGESVAPAQEGAASRAGAEGTATAVAAATDAVNSPSSAAVAAGAVQNESAVLPPQRNIAQTAEPDAAGTPGEGNPLAPAANLTQDWALWRWQMLAGDDALQLGLPAVAEGLYRRVLDELSDTNEDTRRLLGLRIASALIAQRKFDAASAVLDGIPGTPDTPPLWLRRAIIAYSRGEPDAALGFLDGIAPERLSRADTPWYYLLQGMVARGRGNLEAAGPFLQKAHDGALTPAQQAQIEAIMLRGEVSAEKPDPAVAAQLKKQMEQNRGTRAGFDFARQYAVVLDRLDRKDEAIDVLRAQLPLITPLERDEAGQTLLVMGLLAGERTVRGQLAFRDILEGKGSENYQKLALYLMAGGAAGSDSAEVKAMFREMLNRQIREGHSPYGDELLLMRARLELAEGGLAAADADAAQALAAYPASALRRQALWLRAYVAWNEGRYRTAADYLGQIRSLLPEGEERIRVGEVMGDAYFLNRDYATAADVYASLLREGGDFAERGPIVYQAALASTLSGNFAEAQHVLDAEAAFPGRPQDYRLRAEWNLIDEMRLHGQFEAALERLLRAFPLFGRARLDADLLQRLLWLEARLSLDTGNPDRAALLADEILEASPDAAVASYTLLLKARSLIAQKKTAEAQTVLERLRREHPGSDPAILSYLEEAHYFADDFKLSDAQRRLREAADTYPDSPHAPTALYEAAVLANKQGQDSSRREALTILRELIERHPRHPLLFQARLLQGNIARELGEFGVAQDVYEALLRDFGSNSEIYLAELYRANTLLARSASDPTLLGESAAGLERLLDLPGVPVGARIEAGYTLSQILVLEKRFARAQETLWLVVSRYLLDPSQAQSLDGKGRYWMSRALLELGELLEKDGKADDAAKVYLLVGDYGLPGRNLAAARLEKLTSPNTPLR